MNSPSTVTFVSIAVLSSFSLTAQIPEKHIEKREQVWVGYFHQARVSPRLGAWLDVHYRRTDNFVERPFQFLIRPVITCFIQENFRVTSGYAFASHFPREGMKTTRHEHRVWQQLWWSQKHRCVTTSQSIRLEQRFNQRIVADIKEAGYDYNFRARYNLSLAIPLNAEEVKVKTISAVLSNEILINLGDRIVYNTFDQNRFFAGIAYQLNTELTLQAGYMNQFQQQPSGMDYFSTHVVRFFIFHSIDMRSGR